ncbi:MAG: prolipoprotein diacylglyceryl transferase [Sphingomonadales bacterium]|jgi:phosphatidylglycerol:prolipoprotein diacylglycerol transferase
MLEFLNAAALPFPNIDPEIFSIGPFALRWYALAYIVGLLLAWRYVLKLVDQPHSPMARRHADDFFFWAVLGVILGGRIGYILFYNFDAYMSDPLAMLRLWEGGMSFHGGLLGVTLAMYLFCRHHKLSLFRFADYIACGVPIGLFLGRLANFINGELYGRVTDVPWAFIFPTGGPDPRHPSQLYEALMEGLILFVVLWVLFHKTPARRWPGFLVGTYTAGYGVSRFIVETVREPDAHIGFLSTGLTMGQTLSIPMILFGLWLMYYGYSHRMDKPKKAK